MTISLTGQWQPLAFPRINAEYINDHTLFKDQDGQFVLLGTCGKHPYQVYKETSFIEFKGCSDLFKPLAESRVILEGTPWPPIKSAPFVFHDTQDNLYYIFFNSLGRIFKATSEDGRNWSEVHKILQSPLPFLRDPFIWKVNKTFYLYLTDFANRIVVYESNDLDNFSFKNTALQLGEGVPRSANGACESPYLLKIGSQFLLFTTIVPSPFGRRENYTKTYVFLSNNPFEFGVYSKTKTNTAQLVTTLESHAPEILKLNNKYYITTCGWSGFPKPSGLRDQPDGVYIRELTFS